MNILFISHTGGRGGAEAVLSDSIRVAVNDKNNKIFIALTNDGNMAFVESLGELAERCVIEQFSFRPIRNTLPLLARNLGYGMLLGLPKIVRFIKDNNIDLVFVNSSVNVIGVMAARCANRPYLWHIHEQSNDQHRWAPKWFNRYYKKWLFDKRCRSIFVSQTNKNLWLSDLEIDQIPNSTVLYSPYKQINRTVADENRTFTFGYIGSLTENKNVARLINAFSTLPNIYKLFIAGSGESESRLKIAAKGNAAIEFLGHINNLEQFYSKIDCLVVPSLNESWGLVALEAMSAKVPVIITKNSGLVELFVDGKECIFVEPTSIEQIAEAMSKIAEKHNLNGDICQCATKKLIELDVNNKFAAKLLSVINELSR
ncbi:MAG: glycosyltransferase family 4 protein [Mucinivorans sp.]